MMGFVAATVAISKTFETRRANFRRLTLALERLTVVPGLGPLAFFAPIRTIVRLPALCHQKNYKAGDPPSLSNQNQLPSSNNPHPLSQMDSFDIVFNTGSTDLPVNNDQPKPTGWCVIARTSEEGVPVNNDQPKPTGWCVIA
jgi:hypothetical protein